VADPELAERGIVLVAGELEETFFGSGVEPLLEPGAARGN
jgi:hypothetical protein